MTFVQQAEATHSDHLIIIRRDQLLAERHWEDEKPIETQSLTKSIVALAILTLVADGQVATLDAPLHTFFARMARDGRRGITLRHVLTHSTGLDARDGVNEADDRLAFALDLKLRHPPGTRFQYNNAACQLLAGVVRVASGTTLDRYVAERIFAPLGITGARWSHDRAGNVQAYFGLELTSRQLARIGLLLLHEGTLDGRTVVPARLIQEARGPSPTSLSYGLLFWRRAHLQQTREAVDRWPFLAPLMARTFSTEDEYFRAVRGLTSRAIAQGLVLSHPRQLALLRELPHERSGFYGVGGLGQRLAIYPQRRIVAVRQHRRRNGDNRISRTVHWKSFNHGVEHTFVW